MEMRNILRKCMTDFLMIQAGITLATGVLGCFAAPPREVSPTVFFMPFVYAFFCVMPSFVIYSARELSVRAMLVRKVIQFLLIEAIVMLISYISGARAPCFYVWRYRFPPPSFMRPSMCWIIFSAGRMPT